MAYELARNGLSARYRARSVSLAGASALPLLAVASPVLAHVGGGAIGGLTSGFLHPLFGLDHLVAMVGVGLWGAYLGMPAIWLLPIVFPLVMSSGGVFGIAGVPG